MKIAIGLSGGVDSSVAAYLLKQQGYDVIGVTMDTWQGEGENDGVKDAEKVARYLGIPHYVVDYREPFRREIIDYFIEEYLHGRTPNPCCLCNRKVKWQALLCAAKQYGAELVGTGHYARVVQQPNGRYSLTRALYDRKDQTYALYNLTQDQLACTRMPLGTYSKDQIRDVAVRAGIPVADKPDSQDNCFIPEGDYAAFLASYPKTAEQKAAYKAASQPGNFVDEKGNVLGRHKGILNYTVGQRKGLGIALGHPVFVTGIFPERNEVRLGENNQVFSSTLTMRQVNYMGLNPESEEVQKKLQEEGLQLTGKIRYAHAGAPCICRYGSTVDEIRVEFKEPQRAVTPGQAVVLYDEEQSIAMGGRIS